MQKEAINNRFGKFTPYPYQHPMLRNAIIAKDILASKDLQI
jgi:hypothetical protein